MAAARRALEQHPAAAADAAYASLPLSPMSIVGGAAENSAPVQVRVRGVVTATAVGIFLWDSSTNIYARGVLPQTVRAGDVLELVGEPVPNKLTPELKVAASWKLGTGPLPEPRRASIAELVEQLVDSHYVELTGRVAGIIPATDQQNWVMEQNGTMVLVVCPGTEPLALKPGNEVRARGVFSIRRDRGGKILSLRLYLNSPADLEVTKAPPFWTAERITVAGVVVAVVFGGGALWLWLLRRQIASQTLTLQERFDRLAEMERLHGAVFSSLAEGIVVVDARGTIIEANPAAAKICGLPAEQLVGRSTLHPGMDAIHPDGRPCSAEEFPVNTTLRTGQPQSGVVLGLKRGDGERCWISVNSRPLLGPDGAKLDGAVSSFQDITEQVAAEQEAKRLEGQLQQAQKMKALGTLAGGVAHDFNNLLGVILGNTSMARAELEPGHPAATFLDESLRACHRAADVVRQILAFSRKRDALRGVTDLRPIVTEAVNLLRSSIPARVEIEWRMPAKVAPVCCAASEIHQVVMNLCTNAWQALEARAGRIEVELADVPEPAGIPLAAGRLETGPYVRITVRDTGRGIESAVLERMFEPFYTTKPAGEGTGLGLSVVHGIVESHGGAIALTTATGKGTRFDIYLKASNEPLPEGHDVASPLSPTGHGEAILIVDDEPGVARTVQLMLQRQGYSTEYVSTPWAALERLRERPDHFRLLLTDFSMPAMTGCELAMDARLVQPDLVVILMTGYGTDLKPVHLREAGIAEMILKPFSPEALAEVIHRVLVARGELHGLVSASHR